MTVARTSRGPGSIGVDATARAANIASSAGRIGAAVSTTESIHTTLTPSADATAAARALALVAASFQRTRLDRLGIFETELQAMDLVGAGRRGGVDDVANLSEVVQRHAHDIGGGVALDLGRAVFAVTVLGSHRVPNRLYRRRVASYSPQLGEHTIELLCVPAGGCL